MKEVITESRKEGIGIDNIPIFAVLFWFPIFLFTVRNILQEQENGMKVFFMCFLRKPF